MAKRGRRLAREAEMRTVLAKWERSDLPLSRFAKREGIAAKTLYRWRRRLGVGNDLVRRGRPPGRSDDGSLFTEVNIAAPTPASLATNVFEVVFRDGTTVRVPEHVDPDSLRILVQTLRQC